jgi:hypothetical protein
MRCGKVLIKVLDVVELIQDDVEEGPRMFVSIGVVEERDRGSNGRIFGTISPVIVVVVVDMVVADGTYILQKGGEFAYVNPLTSIEVGVPCLNAIPCDFVC